MQQWIYPGMFGVLTMYPTVLFLLFGWTICCGMCSETASPSGSKGVLQQRSAQGAKGPLICLLSMPFNVQHWEAISNYS